MVSGPFLTIVTRTYRWPEYLRRCVASVWAQADRDFQHVVLADLQARGDQTATVGEGPDTHGNLIAWKGEI